MYKQSVQRSQTQIQDTPITVKLTDNNNLSSLKRQLMSPLNSYIQKFKLFQNEECKRKIYNVSQILAEQEISMNCNNKVRQDHRILYQMIEHQKQLEKTLLMKRIKSQGGIIQSISYLPVGQVKVNRSLTQIIAANDPQKCNAYYKKNKSNISPSLNNKINRRIKFQTLKKKKLLQFENSLDKSLDEGKKQLPVQFMMCANNDRSKCQMNFYHGIKKNMKKNYLKQKFSHASSKEIIQSSNLAEKCSTTPINNLISKEILPIQFSLNKHSYIQSIMQNYEKSKSIQITKQNIKKYQSKKSPKIKHFYPKLMQKAQQFNVNSTCLAPIPKIKRNLKYKQVKNQQKIIIQNNSPVQTQKNKIYTANQTFFVVEGWENNHITDYQQQIPEEIQQQ